jgi:hypothetical protein
MNKKNIVCKKKIPFTQSQQQTCHHLQPKKNKKTQFNPFFTSTKSYHFQVPTSQIKRKKERVFTSHLRILFLA